MKRLLSIVLCLCIILTGCQRNAKDNSEGKNPEIKAEDDSQNNEVEQEEANSGLQLMKISKEWSAVETPPKNQTLFTIPAYESKVAPYTIAKDLSNIVNIDRFSGFTKEQVTMLVENGCVVLPSQDTKMFYVYDRNEYTGVPNFITTDSVLHAYHQFYDKSLTSIESNFLYDDLELMTKQMLDKSAQLFKELEDEELKTLQKNNIVYFLVARMLMEQTSSITAKVEDDLMELAKEEYALIDKAEGITRSPFLKVDFDYSQFKIRGHYTKSDELGRFFRTMMWFGIAPYSLVDDKKEVNYENTLQALLMTFTTFLESEGTCDAELWSHIFTPTSQYVGLSDDINIFTMNNLRVSVFGDGDDPNVFHEEKYYDLLIEAVKALPEPAIKANLEYLTTPTGKQFRFMGQRYILDSYVLQNLTDSINRPIPSPLDVMGVMGSDLAEELLFNEYKPQESWPLYKDKYKKLEEEVSNYSTDIWSNNLYNGWLWSIREELTEFDTASGMPFFMTTNSWRNKSLNAALGSYTELKHDTVLYGKQSMAEMGGPLEWEDQHYVEPNVPLYSKLLYLTEYTISVLEERGMMNGDLLKGATDYKTLLELLIKCSVKELRNETLTEEENQQLLWYGGKLENISESFLAGMVGSVESIELSDMLVTDIASYQNSYLSLGTGYFDHIYVVVPIDGKLYLSRGSVYSYYEFTSNERLTDEEWWAQNGLSTVNGDYADYLEIAEPSKDLPKQPSWVETFKTDSNNVEVKSLEVNWDDLVE